MVQQVTLALQAVQKGEAPPPSTDMKSHKNMNSTRPLTPFNYYKVTNEIINYEIPLCTHYEIMHFLNMF